MSEYNHYVAYRTATDEIRDRVERTRRSRGGVGPRRRGGRKALARGLHTIADRLDT
ncbi:MAG TPA: hypothetical protein VFR87_13680 [Nocardioidaceae bacterium]|nr:hypothetical protein [Nocardioidaceae bacterium]